MDKKEIALRKKMAEEVAKAKKEIRSRINEEYGEGSSFCAAKRKNIIVPRISSGSLELDHALGGGYPRGRMIISWGPKSSNKTTAMKRAIADAQKRDRLSNKYAWQMEKDELEYFMPMHCAWVDIEGTFDFAWAESIGINLAELEYTRPQTHEEGIDIVQSYAQSGIYDVIVVDSIAAFTPQDEVEEAAAKQFVGVGARLNNKMFRKLQAVLNERAKIDHRTVPTLFFINQERYKVGCFAYDTKIAFADGTWEKIGKIVNQKINKDVWSVNLETGHLEAKPITDWHNNGKADKFLRVKAKGNNNGVVCMTVTHEHMIFTPTGEVKAESLNVGDKINFLGRKIYNDDQHEIIFGSILGDGGIRFEKDSIRGHLRVGHGEQQAAYCLWKAQMLHENVSVNKDKSVHFSSQRSEEFLQYRDISKNKALFELPDEWIARITPKVAAIWYQDDGTFSGSSKKWGFGKCEIAATKLNAATLQKIAHHFRSIGMGLPSYREGKGLLWSGHDSYLFQNAIVNYVHPSMKYKVKENHCFIWEQSDLLERKAVYEITVSSIEEYVPQDPYHADRYDLTVADNHNYFAGGFMVHNCFFGDPRVKPGGAGQDFYSSVEIQFWQGKKEFWDGEKTRKFPKSIEFNFKIAKNKVSAPHIEGKYAMALSDEPNGRWKTGDVIEMKEVMEFARKLGIYAEVEEDKKKTWKMYDQVYKKKKDVMDEWCLNAENFTKLKQDLMKMLFPGHF